MAQSTPLIPVATLDPVTFYFPKVTSINVALHFFDSAGAVLAVAAGGTRTFLGEIPESCADGATPIGLLVWRPAAAAASIAVPGGEFREFSLGSGAGALTITPSGAVNAAGSTYYRISVSGKPTRVQS